MSFILSYTKNEMIKKAIEELNEGINELFFFSSRLEFLVSASVIKNSVLIVDATSIDNTDIRWMIDKITSRGAEEKLFFIAPSPMCSKIDMKYRNIISNISHLKKICDSPFGRRKRLLRRCIGEVLFTQVSRVLGDRDFEFLENLLSDERRNRRQLDKAAMSKRYTLRKKLSLENILEFNKLFQMISAPWKLPVRECSIKLVSMNKKDIWRNTNTQHSA